MLPRECFGPFYDFPDSEPFDADNFQTCIDLVTGYLQASGVDYRSSNNRGFERNIQIRGVDIVLEHLINGVEQTTFVGAILNEKLDLTRMFAFQLLQQAEASNAILN